MKYSIYLMLSMWRFLKRGFPQIIQLLDIFEIEAHGDLGITQFKKH